MKTSLRHNTISIFLATLTLLMFAAVPESVMGQEAPHMIAQANAPGWITVSWEHTGQDVYYFVIERQNSPYTDSSVFLIGESYNRTDSLTDKYLNADTLYKYHVCAVYADHRTCSDWVSVRTLPAPSSSGGSSTGGSGAPVHPPITAPDLAATTDHAFIITLHWSSDQVSQLRNIQLFRDGQVIFDGQMRLQAGDSSFGSDFRDVVPRANTKYKYKLCFVSLYYVNDTKCSEEITASGLAVPPTAPAYATVSQAKSTGNSRDPAARIRTIITARWRNTPVQQIYVPGKFITLERQDRVQLDRLRVGPAWVEIKQISADGDPTEVTVDVTPEGPELLTQRGNNYRVCAVLPSLGASGKVCSSVISPEPKVILATEDSVRVKDDALRNVFEKKIDLDALAARGEAVANTEALALELRNRQPAGPSRRGFDIGMAAAEGQTLPGPGKQRIHDSLAPAEREGFDIAVAFSLERNRNADLAAKGTAIAAADQTVAKARTAEPDVFYWLGFDIATGIFGDPALGALGNTAVGPGSLKIRDSLSAAAQRGFNAAVKFHLGRSYRR